MTVIFELPAEFSLSFAADRAHERLFGDLSALPALAVIEVEREGVEPIRLVRLPLSWWEPCEDREYDTAEIIALNPLKVTVHHA